MLGLHFLDEVPFDTVYIHALVRDAKGQKMSKSKGNVIDPLELIDQYGADALRFTLASQAAQGRDVKLSEQRVAGNRNFATKLWNAARFCEMNGCTPRKDFDPSAADETVNRWLIGEVQKAQVAITRGIDEYKFNEAASAAYHFVWHTFCDWYLEFAKPLLQGNSHNAREETQATAAWALDVILHLLHPFMPYVTEELWRRLPAERNGMLILSEWPTLPDSLVDAEAGAEMDWVIRLITAVRSVRAEMNVPPSAKIMLLLKGADAATAERLERHRPLIERLARLEQVSLLDGPVPKGAVQTVVDEATLIMPLANVIDLAGERNRLSRELEKLESQIAQIDKKLANENFVSRAPEHVVEEQRERRQEVEQTLERLREALQRLEAA